MHKLLVMTALVFGCVEPMDEVDDPSGGKEDGVAVKMGTYHLASGATTDLRMLVLMSDQTFHATELDRGACPGCTPVPVKYDGTYAFTRRGSLRYLRLLDADGDLIARYRYTFRDDRLKLTTSTGKVLTVERELESWCNNINDCGVQDQGPNPCGDDEPWTCQAHVCACPFEIVTGPGESLPCDVFNPCVDSRDLYCDYSYSAVAECGWGIERGTCMVRPDDCEEDLDQVCGCDGRTYRNACVANRAGRSVAYAGSCD